MTVKPNDKVLYHYNTNMGSRPVLVSVAATVVDVEPDALLLQLVRDGKALQVRAAHANAPASGKWTAVVYTAPLPPKLKVPVLTNAELVQRGREVAYALVRKNGTVTSLDVLEAMEREGIDFDAKRTPWLNLVFADPSWVKVETKHVGKRRVSVWAEAI